MKPLDYILVILRLYRHTQIASRHNLNNHRKRDPSAQKTVILTHLQQIDPEQQSRYMESFISLYQSCTSCLGTLIGMVGAYVPCCCCLNPYTQIDQTSVGLKLRFGKLQSKHAPGLVYVNPCSESLVSVSMQTRLIDLPKTKVYTKDNVGVTIDTVCFFRVIDPVRAEFQVKDLIASITQITYVTLRIVCGEYILQDLLEKRAKINQELQDFVGKSASEWGVFVERILVKDMILEPDLQKNLSIFSTTQRLCQSRIISAKADLESAKLYREAADMLDSKAAMQIRFLQTLGETYKGKGKKFMILPLDSTQVLDQ